MRDEELKWHKTGETELLKTPVFSVYRQREEAMGGLSGEYIRLDAPECVVMLAEYEGDFILVRQWRHGKAALTTEFPGGVIGAGESPACAAYRELLEETGYSAGKLTCLGSVNPNPALFNSRFYVFLCEDLTPTGQTHPDADELIEVLRKPIPEVIASFGSEDMSHAFMGTALAFYMRRRLGNSPDETCKN